MNKKAYVVIDLEGPILKSHLEDFQWSADLFYSLRTICAEGLYSIALLVPQLKETSMVDYVVRTLEGERIWVDSVITDPSHIPSESIDESLSFIISQNTHKFSSSMNNYQFTTWENALAQFSLKKEKMRVASVNRETKETKISLTLQLDGRGISDIETRIPFFNHMLDQIAKHSKMDLTVHCDGDIEVDEHHSVEDVAISLGQALSQALQDKRGISRYGSAIIPMDDVVSTVSIDFSNRPYFVWDVDFSREMVGTFPTEMVYHFFKSFSDEARCNLNMSVTKGNAHHQVESLFKGCARAIREAIFRYPGNTDLPSTKGVL